MFNKKTRRLSPGIHTAAVTPFRRGEPDLKAFNRLLSDQLSSRVAGVVVLGTTGEAPTVTDKERGGIGRRGKGAEPVLFAVSADKSARLRYEPGADKGAYVRRGIHDR